MRKDSHNRERRGAIKRSNNRRKGGEDRMSELPDDILISIISRLTLQEATATCVLSHRWRHLHTSVTHLTFPPFTPKQERSNRLEFEKERFRNHVKMIDGVLDSHRGGRVVKELKLCMYRMKGASVEKWVEFALSKDIEIIDINLHLLPCVWPLTAGGRYSLGLPKLILTKPALPFPALKCLKQLSLGRVDINEQDFELLVSNFVALESVCIEGGMQELKKVSIVGHPKLKHVEIRSADSLESLEIRDVMNLLSLRFYRLSMGCTAVELKNIPKLTEFYYGDYNSSNLPHDHLFARIPSCIRDQLQLLHISTSDFGPTRHDAFLWELPFEFVNIKHMELEAKHMNEIEFTWLYKLYLLIHSCPSLQKLKIKFVWWMLDFYGLGSIKFWKKEANVYDPYHKKLSPNLKELEMEGYVGSPSEFKLASYIINYAANLEQVIVVACDASSGIQRKSSARARSDFRKIAPPPLHVLII